MSHWHPDVLPIVLFVLAALSMLCYTAMRADAPRTTWFAGIGSFVLTLLSLKVFGLWPSVALVGGLVTGYCIFWFYAGFFRSQSEIVVSPPPYDPLFHKNERQVERWCDQRFR